MSKRYDKDPLGQRMKDYEKDLRSTLDKSQYVILRLDGKAFHTFTKQLKKPYDQGLMDDLDQSTIFLCENIQNAKLGFVQSDEISIVMSAWDTETTQMWYGGDLEKIVSVSASLVTGKFNFERMKRKFKTTVRMSEYDLPKPEHFDSRVFQLPNKEEVVNYMIWRQNDAWRNSISMIAQHHFSHKELNCKSTQERIRMLQAKGVMPSALPMRFTNGGLCRKVENQIKNEYFGLNEGDEFVTRQSWEMDNNFDLIIRDRTYIKSLIPDMVEAKVEEDA